MGPQAEDYIETVLTCEGDYYDPEFHAHLQKFSQKLEQLLVQDHKKKKLILKKVEPWNSVRVTFNIPKEAALRLKCLAEQGDTKLKELGILAVEIEGDRKISLKIAGKNNETTELIFNTRINNHPVTSASSNVDTNSSDDMNIPGPSALSVENTRINIQEYLVQGATSLFGNLLSPTVNAPNSKTDHVSNGNSGQAANLGISSQMSPKFPTPPPSVSTPNSPNTKGAPALNAGIGSHQANPFGNQAVQNMVKLLGSRAGSASPLLVNLLQNDLAAGNLHMNIAQALSTFPQGINSVFPQNSQSQNKGQFPGDSDTSVPPPPKKKRRPRKPKEKDGQQNKKLKSALQNESTIIQNILSQAVGNGGQQQEDPRVPPLGEAEQSSAVTANISKVSTPSTSRAGTPAKSPCPAPPRSPIHGQPLAPNQRHIINPTTGQLELVEEDSGFTPPKRDFPPKESKVTQCPVPQNPVTLNPQNNQLIRDNGSPIKNQRSSPPTAFLSVRNEGMLQSMTVAGNNVPSDEKYLSSISAISTVSDTVLHPQVMLSSGYTKTCQSNSLISGDNPLLSQSMSQTASNVASLPQTISAILSNVSKSGSIALATLNLPTVQDSMPSATMQNTTLLDSIPSHSAVIVSTEPKGNLAVNSSDTKLGEGSSAKVGSEIPNQNNTSASCTNPVLSGINNISVSSTSLRITTPYSTSSAFRNTNLESQSTLYSVPLITSQTVGNTGNVPQGKGAINVNTSSVGPIRNMEVGTTENCLPSVINNENSAQKPTHPHSVQKSLAEQGPSSLVGRTCLVSTGVNGGNIESNNQIPSGINELTNPHHHDSEHSSQSCEDHGKHGSGSVDSGLGDIKENNGESPCGSSGNDSPGVTVSSSGNRDSDTEKDKDFSSQSDKNVITVGYVLSKSENPSVEMSVCDKYVKCNSEDIGSSVHKQLLQKTANINSKDSDICDTTLHMPSMLKLPTDLKVNDETRKKSLSWNGRSDLKRGLPNGENFTISQVPQSKKLAPENEIGEETSSLVQVCSNDAKVLAQDESNDKYRYVDLENSLKDKSSSSTFSKKSNDVSTECAEDSSEPLQKDLSTASKSSSEESCPKNPNELFFTQQNILIDHVHDIHSYSDIKVTDDNTVIIDIKNTNCETSATENTNDIVYEGDIEINDNVIVNIPMDLQQKTVNSISAAEEKLLQETKENTEADKEGKSQTIVKSDHQPSPSKELCVAKGNPESSTANMNVIYSRTNTSNTEIVTTTTGNSESSEMSQVSNLHLVKHSKAVASSHNLTTSSTNILHIVSTKPSESLLTSMALSVAISTIAPSVSNIQNVTKVATSVNQGQLGMANLGPSPIMSTGLPYFSSTTIQESQNLVPVADSTSEKLLKGSIQKGISIMKPLRDRESSIDEDLLESPIKDKNLSSKPEKVEKSVPVATISHNKRSSFTVAQLLDEADKVKQTQSMFKPYVSSDKNENLFTPVSITASATLKQIANNVDEVKGSDSETMENTDKNMIQTVPNFIKTSTVNDTDASGDTRHSCNSNFSVLAPINVTTGRSPPSAMSTSTSMKLSKSGSEMVVHQSPVTISVQDYQVPFQSVQQVPKIATNPSPDFTSSQPVSPNLVNLKIEKSNSNLELPLKISVPVTKENLIDKIVSSANCDVNKEVMCKQTKLTSVTVFPLKQQQQVTSNIIAPVGKKMADVNSSKSSTGEFIKIEPEPKIPATVKNVITVKSSLTHSVSNNSADVKTVDKISKVSNNVSDELNVVTVQKMAKRMKHATDINTNTVIDLRSQINSVHFHEHSYSAKPSQLQNIPVYPLSSMYNPSELNMSNKNELVSDSEGGDLELNERIEEPCETYATSSDNAIQTNVVQSLSTKCVETISSSKHLAKTIHRDGGKTLTITGGRLSESNEPTKVTLDLRSAVTHPSSASKFIKLEPGKDWGPSSINKVSSNITVKVKGDVHKQDEKQTVHTPNTQLHGSESTMYSTNKLVFLHGKPQVINENSNIVYMHNSNMKLENEHLIPESLSKSTKRKSTETVECDLQPPAKSIKVMRRKSSETPSDFDASIKPAARVTRSSSRGSTDSKASSTEGNRTEESPTALVKHSLRKNRSKTTSESSEFVSVEQPSSRRNSVSSSERSHSPALGTRNSKCARRKVTEKEKSPDTIDDQSSSVNSLPESARSTRNSKRKLSSTEESDFSISIDTSSPTKKVNSIESVSENQINKKIIDCKEFSHEEEKNDMDSNRKVSIRVRSIKNKHNDLREQVECHEVKGMESEKIDSKESSTSKRSTRSTRSVGRVIPGRQPATTLTMVYRHDGREHCELPNNYLAKKKPKTH